MSNSRFQEKVVFITGGASGLGAATATKFAAEGAKVVIADVNTAGATAFAATLPDALAVTTDTSDAESVEAAFATAIAHYGHIDVIFNNAGIDGKQQKLHEMDRKQLEDSLTGYQEQPAQKLQTPFGESRVSEWTGTGNAGALHGYRATMLGREREITVICLAPVEDWDLLQPAFHRVINSVTPGSGPS